MQHVMIDIETMGTVPGSAIVSIGAYNLHTKGEFYTIISLESNFKYRMSVDGPTMEWWVGQGEEAKNLFKFKDKAPLDGALQSLVDWLPDKKELGIWGNGSVFDITLLEVALRRVNIPIPWNYGKIFDLRTIAMLYPEIKKPKNYLAHNSLADAKCQGIWLQQMLDQHNRIGRK